VWNNFWYNSSNNKRIFTLQNKIIRIMAGTKPKISRLRSCKLTFNILRKMQCYTRVNTRYKYQLHRPLSSFSCFQLRTYNECNCILPHNCHLQSVSSSCTTHHQTLLQDFPYTSKVLLHKNSNIKLPILQEMLNMMSLYMHTISIPFK
jgi:hypothetical protein